jgi:hypothetical protein
MRYSEHGNDLHKYWKHFGVGLLIEFIILVSIQCPKDMVSSFVTP